MDHHHPVSFFQTRPVLISVPADIIILRDAMVSWWTGIGPFLLADHSHNTCGFEDI